MGENTAAVNYGIDLALPFSHVPNALLFADGITLADVRVWAALKAYHYQRLKFTPAGFVAHICGRSRSQVWASIKKLMGLGWVVKVAEYKGKASTYRVVENPGVEEVDPSRKLDTPSPENWTPPVQKTGDDREKELNNRERADGAGAALGEKGTRRLPSSADAEAGAGGVGACGRPRATPAGRGAAARPGLAREGVGKSSAPGLADVIARLNRWQEEKPLQYSIAFDVAKAHVQANHQNQPDILRRMEHHRPETWARYYHRARKLENTAA